MYDEDGFVYNQSAMDVPYQDTDCAIWPESHTPKFVIPKKAQKLMDERMK
jgi:hypothetical protein